MHQAAESHKLISHQTAKTRHQTNFELMPSQNRRVFTWFHMVSHGFTWFHMVSHGFTHQKGALNHGKGGVIILAAVLFEVVPPPNATRFEGALETSGVGSPHVE